MRKGRAFLILGIWVAILPYFGVPHFWKNILMTLSGLVLVYISYLIYRQEKQEKKEMTYDNFSENREP